MSSKREVPYLYNLGKALTRCLAALIGADYRMSFSAQTWLWYSRRKWRGIILRPIVDLIFFLDPNHCYRAYADYHRERLPESCCLCKNLTYDGVDLGLDNYSLKLARRPSPKPD